MPNVYVRRVPKGGRKEARSRTFWSRITPIMCATFKTQKEAIDWSRKNDHAPLGARVRHLNDKKVPDHRRAG